MSLENLWDQVKDIFAEKDKKPPEKKSSECFGGGGCTCGCSVVHFSSDFCYE